MTLRFPATALLALVFAGCTAVAPAPQENSMTDMQEDAVVADGTIDEDEGAVDAPDDEQVTAEASAHFAAYTPEVLTDGQPKVLFFHAAWCPICRQADQDLRGWYAAGTPMLSTYVVDYDTETQLKSRYGVTYQHTFVLVDGEGNALRTLQGPSADDLKGLIGV